MEDRLRKFAQVVDSGSFSQAAIALHISQPALTTAVKKLERELGAVLLMRQAKRLTLTAAGDIAYQAAKSLNSRVYNLRYELTRLAQQRPVIRLGLIDSIADILAGEHQGFAALRQAADLSVVINNSTQLTLATVKEQLEAAIIVGGVDDLPKMLTATFLGQESLTLVVHPAEQRRYRQFLSDGRLPNFLSYNSGSHSHHLIAGLLSEIGISAEPTFYSTSPEVMLKMVLSRQGAAVLPFAMVEAWLEKSSLISVTPGSGDLSRPIYAIRLQDRMLPQALEDTFSTASSLLDQLMRRANQHFSGK